MIISNKKIKRLFTFGCSFTKYQWATWPEIIAFDLDIPFYNYGKSGAGNQYIANMICQADAIYHFDENDLVIVSWTNVSREDRWVNNQWITPGNVYTQDIYDMNFINKWIDPLGLLVRDLASFKLIRTFLESKKCDFRFLSMCDIIDQFDQSSAKSIVPENSIQQYSRLLDMYSQELNFMQLSFFKVLWNNNISKNKFNVEKSQGRIYFQDGHPYPVEHLQYLKTIFSEHTFQKNTVDAVEFSQKKLKEFIDVTSEKYKRPWAIYEISVERSEQLYKDTSIKLSEIIEFV
jgi:hypothetical protein